jgi:hypothetical protein
MLFLRRAIQQGLPEHWILERLRAPSDFAIVALVIAVDSLEIFNERGQTLVLIPLENPMQERYNSAFTVTFDAETAMDETAN